MKYACLLLLLISGLVAGCSSGRDSASAAGGTPTAGALANAKVIDVRSPEEYEEGHVSGTTNIPIDELSTRIAVVVPDKGTPLMVHCQSGNRSARAKTALNRLGYTNVTDLGSLANARKVVEGK